MKLTHTNVVTETIEVTRGGQTIGSLIDLILVEAGANSIVTSVTVEITDEDRTALRLLASPAWQHDNGVPKSEPVAEMATDIPKAFRESYSYMKFEKLRAKWNAMTPDQQATYR